jgi:isopentenyl diphosphate isomerase/L-lactate dehydrogenase-like FMN-dependent dehydrogenase
VDGGAEDESTLRENCSILRFHVSATAGGEVPDNLRTTVLGMGISFPTFLAPVGYSG